MVLISHSHSPFADGDSGAPAVAVLYTWAARRANRRAFHAGVSGDPPCGGEAMARKNAHESDATGARSVAETEIVMARTMQPPDANVWGAVHGGAIMRLVDEAGGAVAQRHSRRPCVTVAMDSMIFKEPVSIGDFLTGRSRLTYVGVTSMEVEARIEAENLLTGAVRNAGTCHLHLRSAGRRWPAHSRHAIAPDDARGGSSLARRRGAACATQC